MIVASQIVETIKSQSKNLPVSEKVELIRFLTESLSERTGETPLKFGKYSNAERTMSTEEDLRIAEWNPSDTELDGH